MKERGLMFKAEMVRAILEGRKTQTRRIVKPEISPFVQQTPDCHPPKHPEPYLDAYCGEKKTDANPRGMSRDWCWWTRDDRPSLPAAKSAFIPGDVIWVKETWAEFPSDGDWIYRAEYSEALAKDLKWKSAMFMPRRASRLALIVTDVRVRRLQDISEEDAKAEGIRDDGAAYLDYMSGDYHFSWAVSSYQSLWESINGPGSWDANPWVWAYTFEVKR